MDDVVRRGRCRDSAPCSAAMFFVNPDVRSIAVQLLDPARARREAGTNQNTTSVAAYAHEQRRPVAPFRCAPRRRTAATVTPPSSTARTSICRAHRPALAVERAAQSASCRHWRSAPIAPPASADMPCAVPPDQSIADGSYHNRHRGLRAAVSAHASRRISAIARQDHCQIAPWPRRRAQYTEHGLPHQGRRTAVFIGLLDMGQDAVEFVEAVVGHNQLALAAGSLLNQYLGAEPVARDPAAARQCWDPPCALQHRPWRPPPEPASCAPVPRSPAPKVRCEATIAPTSACCRRCVSGSNARA